MIGMYVNVSLVFFGLRNIFHSQLIRIIASVLYVFMKVQHISLVIFFQHFQLVYIVYFLLSL